MVIMNLYKTPGTWLSGTGPESSIVISSRIRLARNVEGFPFVNRMKKGTKQEFVDFFLGSVQDLTKEYDLKWIEISQLDRVDLSLLLERHLISREIIDGSGCRGILVNREETIAVMVNEEDHLRIQYLASGLQLGSIWNKLDKVDDQIDACVPYAFSPELGFLTSCPTNLGTGIRVSVMLHLPGLSITDQVKKVFKAVSTMGLTVRGLYGEGTEGIGDFYQVSNQKTLGFSETDIIKKVEAVVPKVITYEENARKRLIEDNMKVLNDRIWRAYGILRYARSVSSEETLTLLSLVRLGVNLGIIKDVDITAVNNLFIYSQPSHLQKRANREMGSSERDTARADYIRKSLHGE